MNKLQGSTDSKRSINLSREKKSGSKDSKDSKESKKAEEIVMARCESNLCHELKTFQMRWKRWWKKWMKNDNKIYQYRWEIH